MRSTAPCDLIHNKLAEWVDAVTPLIAFDIGEYLALRRVYELHASAFLTISDDDARRALRFAVGWIARYEAFERAYPDERWAGEIEAIEPPREPSIFGPAVVDIDAFPLVMEWGSNAGTSQPDADLRQCSATPGSVVGSTCESIPAWMPSGPLEVPLVRHGPGGR